MAQPVSKPAAFMQALIHRDMSGLGLLDYALVGFGSSLAVWSAGMSIGSDRVAFFSSSLVMLGCFVSYLMRFLARGQKWVIVDGVLYALSGACSAIFAADLMTLMPQGGFPRELFAAGWLSWMMIFGSFCGWRDATLLFQAVPAIALFGLVGCYDTYKGVTFAFYGFMLCLATFFARAHGRQMLEESVNSGFFTRGRAPGAAAVKPETTPGLAQILREGPWRWAAGPEWALASAFVVVLISLLGAPVVQIGMTPVSGFIRLAVPRMMASSASTLPPIVTSAQTSDSVGIGRGAVKLTETPVLDFRMDRVRYLRNAAYDKYNGRGWQRVTEVAPDRPVIQSRVIEKIAHPNEYSWTIRLQQPLRVLPVPGEVIASTLPSSLTTRPDGTISVSEGTRLWTPLYGTSIEPAEPIEATKADTDFAPASGDFLSPTNLPPRAADLARRLCEGAANDWEKAQRIKEEIAKRIKYNINTPAVPGGEDPVDYTLFETKEAYCDVFASAMTLMARSVGIPARYATGFLPKQENSLGDGSVVVLERDAHAWAELFFEGTGWVIFDATEGAEAVPGGELGSSTDNRPWYKQDWFVSLLNGAILLLVAAGMFYGFRAYAYRKAHPDFRSDLDRVYLNFTRAMYKKSGIRRGIGVTADEYMSRISPSLGSAAAEAQDVSKAFVRAYYAPGTIDEATVRSMREQVQKLRKALS